MIDELFNLISSIETGILISVAFGIGLSVVSYFLSPVLLRYVLKYISTDSIDFNQKRFIGNAQWAISATFLFSVISLITMEYQFYLSLDSIAESFLLTVVAVLWLRVVHNLGQYAIKKIVSIRYDQSMIPIVENIWTLVIILGSTFLVFEVWGVDLTPLLASAGIAGVVLGLAARETISNFFGSIALYADNTYETGDFIELTDGKTSGYVNDISIRSTQLITLAGNKVVVPNSKLHNSIIKNKSDPNDEYRILLNVGVSYSCDPENAEKTIRRAVEQVIDSEESYKKAWFFGSSDSYKVFIQEFADSSIMFKVFAKVNRPEDEPRIKSRFYESIYKELEKEEIEIPYPQRSIHFDSETKNNVYEMDDRDSDSESTSNFSNDQ